MNRVLYLWLWPLLWLVPACSFVNDFDGYDFKIDAALEAEDPRGKPRKPADGGEPLETGPAAHEDGSQGAVDAADGQALMPAPDGAQAPPEAGSVPDAGQGEPGPLEGAWDVELELLDESCPGNTRVERDHWQLERLGAGAARLQGAAWTLAGALSGQGEGVGKFEGELESVRWRVTLVRDGAELGGQLIRTELEPGGIVGCRVTRMVRGTR